MDSEALDRAALIVGSATQLAKALGVSKATVSLWRKSPVGVPIDYCAPIDRLTHGAVTCEQLRPDYDFSRASNPPTPTHLGNLLN